MGLHNKPAEHKNIEVLQKINKSASEMFVKIDNSTMNAIRIILSVIILAVCIFLDVADFLLVFLLVVATILLGYDVIISLVKDVEAGKYYTINSVLAVASLIGFIVGMGVAVVAMLLVYQIARMLVDVAEKSGTKAAIMLAGNLSEEERAKLEEDAANGTYTIPEYYNIRKYSDIFLKIAAFFALVYVILVPAFFNVNFKEALYRAICVLLITTPVSVFGATPLTGIYAAAYAHGKGIEFNNAYGMQNLSHVNSAVFDKDGIFASSSPELVDIIPAPSIDKNTLITVSSHAMYYSEQWFAKPVVDLFGNEYQLDAISDFKDIMGYGVILKIGNTPVEIGTGMYFSARKIAVPVEKTADGITAFYVLIGLKYAGKILIKKNSVSKEQNIVNNLKECGITKSYLLSKDGEEADESLSEEYGFDRVFTISDADSKLQSLEEVNTACSGLSAFVYSEGIETHSSSLVDIRFSKKSKFADITIFGGETNTVKDAFLISDRVNELVKAEAVFAFVVKCIILVLAFSGYCALWLSVLVDFFVMLITLFMASRVPEESLIKAIKAGKKK